MANGIDPIADEELIYRRVPVSTGWYDPDTNILDPQAFGPHRERDKTGISVARSKYKTAEQAAIGQPGRSYYVAVLNVGDLRHNGIQIVPRPETAAGIDAAHAEMPDLNAANRKDKSCLEAQRKLVELCRGVIGPFDTPT